MKPNTRAENQPDAVTRVGSSAVLGCRANDDPYHDNKIYHKAAKINQHGQASALCYPIPRPIPMNRERWTLRDEAVTCPKCLKILKAIAAQPNVES